MDAMDMLDLLRTETPVTAVPAPPTTTTTPTTTVTPTITTDTAATTTLRTQESDGRPVPERKLTKPDRALPSTPTETDNKLAQSMANSLILQPSAESSSTSIYSDTPSEPAPVPPELVELPPSQPPSARTDDTHLTPLRAHYLKKTLVELELSQELQLLTTPPHNPEVSTLSFLGSPFAPAPKGAQVEDLPLLRYMFRQFVLTFPFLSAAPKDFFSGKLQPFVASLLSRNLGAANPLLDTEDDQTEAQSRRRMFQKMEKHIGLVLGAATKLSEPEDVVRLTQKDLERLEELARRRKRRVREEDVFDVNIVSVRSVIAKGRVRSRAHEEFVVRTRRSDFPDIFVSRRYGDFRTLAEELRKQHPMENVRPPPGKDKAAATFTQAASSSIRSMYGGNGSGSGSGSGSVSQANSNSDESLPKSFPGSFTPTPQSSGYSSPSGSVSGSAYAQQATSLSREKNRLTLRAYLHSLLANSALASSPVLRSFLTANPIKLSPEEEVDMHRREEADRVREEGRKRFAKEVAVRVEGLRGAVREVKGNLMAKDGLTQIFSTVKITSDIKNLPADYQAVIAWGRISLAAAIFQTFVASDTGSETLANLKRIHGMMPYFMLKGILRISNPIAMIRGVLDLFLAAPFGGPSLLQRMFSTSLSEEVKGLQEDIQGVKDKIQDDVLCEKVKIFVDAPAEIQQVYKADAEEENIALLAVIFRSPEGPPLDRDQFQRVVRASRAHATYLHQRASLDDSDDDTGPSEDEAWLFEDLGILLKLSARLKDREQMLALIFEGSTAELLKDIITIFYSPLAQVYKAASIADSLGDLQTFITDLIRTVEAVEELRQEDPHRTVQTFIDLVQRHEQSFYTFVHRVHSKGAGLFDGLIRWIELFLDLMREGLGSPVSLEFILPAADTERAEIFREVDKVAHYHYRLKVAYEEKLRRRFNNGRNDTATQKEEEIARDLVDGVVRDLSFGELVRGDATGIAAEESDDEKSDEYDSDESDETTEESESEVSTQTPSVEERKPMHRPTRSATITSHSSQRTASTLTRRATVGSTLKKPALEAPRSSSGMGQLPKPKLPKQAGSDLQPPDLKHIPILVPIFVEIIRPSLIPRSL
ncbi:hypothetical protein DACRYDRAFT_92330 [Dacryopinax primogenitus]|uniref:PX domain-containing protein n=1 Tax=Dacryopinax primogenitus (strain DJM 731) TaxID=1858805 RepID=M5GCJ1_DACPD|nr:uncharacterized protein DACRYDRAFT_92330 [Dacryopinax primogenitus]EJU06240.1 hypothetical protein DACRYDRAFT_92330 [Dacryopinax primogenitus]